MNRSYQDTHLLGQAGVLRVAYELMLRGIHVLIPSVDFGVDLYTTRGTRIQVKTSRRLDPNSTSHFMLCSGYRLNRNGKSYPDAKIFSEICDFVVLYNVASERFWIVPALILDGRKSIAIGQGVSVRLTSQDRIDILTARDNQESWSSLAERYGMSVGAIRQIVKSPLYGTRHDQKGASIVPAVMEHENDWQTIMNFEKVLTGESTPRVEVCHS